MKKHILSIILAVVMIFTSGCGMKPEEATAYTQAILDASYLGKFDEYIEQTKSTEEDAKQMYERNINLSMESMGFDEDISEEIVESYRQVLIDLVKQAKYKVSGAKEMEDVKNGYEVTVFVEPFVGFESLEDDLSEALFAKIDKMDKIPSDEKINKMTYEIMCDLMAESVANPIYGDAVEVKVHVVPDEDNIYHIPEKDMVALDEVMFPIE